MSDKGVRNRDYTIGVSDLPMQCFDGRLSKPLKFWAPVKIHSSTYQPIRTLDGSYIYALPGGGSIKGG